MAKPRRGKFIVFEGGEGAGKTTLAQWLAKEYGERTKNGMFLTKEPGGDMDICKRIRELLLDPQYRGRFSPRAELLGFEMDRAQHVDLTIKPALERGITVICDRFEASTYAYQCGARGVCGWDLFQSINSFATRGLRPDLTFWIDVDPEIGLWRKQADERNRFEAEEIEFHRALRRGFEGFFAMHERTWPAYPVVKLKGEMPLKILKNAVLVTTEEHHLFS